MKLKFKLLLSIVLLGSALLLVGGFSYYSISKTSMIKQVLENDKENVIYISETIENDLLELVRLTTTIASTNVIKDSLLISNDDFSSLTVPERADYIDELNALWVNTADVNDPFIKTRMENDVASFLISQQNQYPDLYGEIFLTNKYGVMISTTGKLTTLAHYEKYWWQESFADGEGIVYLDDRGYDASSEGYVLGIVVPVYDDNDEIIGILKSNYNISYIFENSVASFHDLNSDGKNYIVRTLGLIVDGENIVPLSTSISDDILPYIEEIVDTSTEISIDGNPSFLTIVPINLTYSSNIISFGGQYESVDHSGGNLGEGWSVVHIVDKQIALKGLNKTLTMLSFVSFGMLVLIGIAALYIGEMLSKPFKELNEYISEVGKGKLVKKDIRVSGYEIEALTISFNRLIDNLNSTLTSKKELENEKEIAQKYLDDLILAGNIFENSIENAPIPIIIHAEDGTVLNISRSWTELTHYTKSDIPTMSDWTKKAYGQNKDKVDDFIKKLYSLKEIQHDDEFVVTTKDGRKLTWDFHSGYIGNLPDGRAIAMSVAMDVTERLAREQEISFLSYHDSLTGLHNRRYYEDNLTKLDIPQNYPLTMVMSDINGLKLINDAFGHSAGDKLLISAANLISDSCRETDLIARIGGDEFVIVMPKTSGAEAEKIIEKINKEAKKVTIKSIELSISFGFKTKKSIKEDIQVIYRGAEDLMYRVKLIEIPSMRSGAIETILKTLYEKDKRSEIHSRIVSNISEKLAVACGMDRQEVNEVKTAGLLHDIGKIVIPISIITKKGKLTPEEYDLIKEHPEIGFRILNSTYDMRNISNIVLNHHERWDGLGYPRGIKAGKIPLQSRIIAIADAFDAMTSERTYREIFTNEQALDEIINNAGTQFDPELAKIFADNFKAIIEIKK